MVIVSSRELIGVQYLAKLDYSKHPVAIMDIFRGEKLQTYFCMSILVCGKAMILT